MDFPGAKRCLQKTWINDCGTNMIATISGAAANFTPTITSAFGNPCNTVSGIVIGPNKAAIAWPEYPLGILTSNPDGSIAIQFTPFDDGSQECFATYKITQGSFMNGTQLTAAQLLGGGAGALPGASPAATLGAPGTTAADISAYLNASTSSLPSLLLSAAALLLCLLATQHML